MCVISIQLYYLVQDGPWNNYGIDCDIVQKYLKVSDLFLKTVTFI